MRLSLFCVSLFLAACGPASKPAAKTHSDPTAERWYGQTLADLTTMNRGAKESFEKGKADQAAALIVRAEPLSKRLLSVPKPTLAATVAASDLDELYGRMLFSNRNYGWARLMFQKNLARWKYWKPQTPDTAARLSQAQADVAECDRRINP